MPRTSLPKIRNGAGTTTRQGWPMNGVVDSVEAFIRRFCILPEAAYLPLTLWTMATHLPDAFDAFPYVALLSPIKGCGKTRVLEVLHLLVARPEQLTSASPASIFRLMENFPTLLLDEVEALRSRKPSESAQTILSILNAGHRKGGSVPRCELVKQGDSQKWVVVKYPVHGFKAFAAIGRLPDTLADRCVRIPMQRKTDVQVVGRFLRARALVEAAPIHDCLAAWAESRREDVANKYADIEDLPFLGDREVDLWMPLFAVCKLAAPSRVNELMKCALTLCGDKAADDVDDSQVLKLLSDVRNVWPADRLPIATESLLKALQGVSDSPWETLNPIALAKMLRPFGPQPRTVRTGDGTAKGYQYRDFVEVFSRYLPSTGSEPVTPVTTCINIEEKSHFQSVTSSACDGSGNALNTA